jgi:LacI family transcriptional regulator
MKKRATMTDIAIQAGVSQSTVSLVLNAMTGAKLSKETRQKVLRIANEMGYQLPEGRKPQAANAVTTVGATSSKDTRRLILYLVDEISTSPHPVISVDGAKDAAWSEGALVAVFATRSNMDIESAVLRSMLGNPMLSGVIYSTIFTRQVVPPPELKGIPTVLLNCYETHSGEPHTSYVLPSEVVGGHTATEYLIKAGHKRIGFINGEPWMDAAKDRFKGYRRALTSADIAFDAALTREGDWQMATGFSCTLSLMQETHPPTAIFCANDLMATGCLEALHQLGLQVPADVSVIGYDDQEIARHTRPPLTTLVLPSYEMGRLATELLLDEVNSLPQRKRRIKVDAQLVERETVAAPKIL